MDKKRMLTAVAISSISMWIIAGLWHNLIMPGLYAQSHASHDGIGLLFIAYLILALLMAYLYARIYGGDGRVIDGLKLGTIIGILWVFPHDLAMAGAHGGSVIHVLKNSAWHMVEQGLGGAVMAYAYTFRVPGRTKRSEKSNEV